MLSDNLRNLAAAIETTDPAHLAALMPSVTATIREMAVQACLMEGRKANSSRLQVFGRPSAGTLPHVEVLP